MAAPVIESTVTTMKANGAGFTIDVAIPGKGVYTASSYQLVVCLVGDSNNNWGTPLGWTLVGSHLNNGTSVGMWVRQADGSEPTTVTWTRDSSNTAAVIAYAHRIYGGSVTFEDIEYSSVGSTSHSIFVSEPLGADRLILVFGGKGNNTVLSMTTGAADYTAFVTDKSATHVAAYWTSRAQGATTPPSLVIGSTLSGVMRSISAAMVPGPPPALPSTLVVAGGNILPRAITSGKVPRWLLELDVGSEILRVGTARARPESRRVNGPVLFRPGLGDLEAPLAVDSASLEISGTVSIDWSRHRPLLGRRAKLWRWYDGQVLEDAFLALDGVVTSATTAPTSDAAVLSITVDRAPVALSIDWPRPEAIATPDNWVQDPGRYISERVRSTHYPTVIGRPGRVVGDVTLGTPALFVRQQTLAHTMVVAGHHVQATDVFLYNRATGDSIAASPVTNTYDDGGNPVATVEPYGDWPSMVDATIEDELFAGWDDRGLVGVDGLGDLLVWGARNLSTAEYDLDLMAAEADALNRYQIDTYWVEPMTWEDWLQANILGTYPVVETQGPRGRYYRALPLEVTEDRVVATLTTAGSGAGRRVERVSAITEGLGWDGGVCNVLEIDYGALPTSGTARRKLLIGPRRATIPGPPSGAQITTTAASGLAARSYSLFGPRYERIEVPTTWDASTVHLLARWHFLARALPGRRVVYQGGDELLEIREGDVVRVRDTRAGADLDGALGWIEDITILSAGTRVQVYIPEV